MFAISYVCNVISYVLHSLIYVHRSMRASNVGGCTISVLLSKAIEEQSEKVG